MTNSQFNSNSFFIIIELVYTNVINLIFPVMISFTCS